jgi:hypothetical protein
MSRRALTALLLFLAPAGALASDPGGEFRVPGHQGNVYPAVTMDAGGRFLVAWVAYDPDLAILAQIFAPGGAPQGEPFTVGAPAGENQRPVLVALDAAGISAVWSGDGDHSGPFAYFRRFDRNGSPLTEEIYLGMKGYPVVATGQEGDSTVLAQDGREIIGWRFDRYGRLLRRAFRITGDSMEPAVAAVPAGFLALWRSYLGITGRLYDASGAKGPAFRVTPDESRPSVAANPGGRFAVAWPSERGVRLRLYSFRGRADRHSPRHRRRRRRLP